MSILLARMATHPRPESMARSIRRDVDVTVLGAPSLAWVVLVAGSILYSGIGLGIHHSYGSGMDLTIFSQALGAMADGREPLVPVKGSTANLFGDHWHPLVVILVPLFWLWDDPAVLLVAQAVCVAAAAAILTATARRRASSAQILGPALLVSPGVAAAMSFDFHEVALGAPILALGCAAFMERRWRSVMVWSLWLLPVKEDAGLMVLGLAGALWWAGQRWRAVVLAATSMTWMALAVWLFIPAVNGGGQYTYTRSAGGGLPQLFATLGQSLLWPGLATLTAIVLVGVTGGAALRSPLVLVAFLPWLVRAAVPNWRYWALNYHYSLLPAVALFFAAVDSGLVQTRARRHRFVAAMMAVSTIALVPVTANRMIVHDAAAAAQAVAQVPDEAHVATMANLSPHLARRATVTVLVEGTDPTAAGQPTATADWILLDRNTPWAQQQRRKHLQDWDETWCNHRYCLLRR